MLFMASQSARLRMPSGRLHRRIHLTVSVRLVEPGEREVAQNAFTENVSPGGVRVVVKSPREPGALLFLKSPIHGFRTSVRVVYCEPLSGAQFGVGLQLQDPSVNWAETFTDSAA
jgi:hypothetical protein